MIYILFFTIITKTTWMSDVTVIQQEHTSELNCNTAAALLHKQIPDGTYFCTPK